MMLQVLGAAEHAAQQSSVRGLDYLDTDHPTQVPTVLLCLLLQLLPIKAFHWQAVGSSVCVCLCVSVCVCVCVCVCHNHQHANTTCLFTCLHMIIAFSDCAMVAVVNSHQQWCRRVYEANA